MDFILPRAVILTGLKRVSGVVETRASLQHPECSGILLKVSPAYFLIAATDKELEVVTQQKIIFQEKTSEVKQPGECILPFRKFYDIIRALPEGSVVHLSLDSEKMILKSGRSRFRFTPLSPDAFPETQFAGKEVQGIGQNADKEETLSKEITLNRIHLIDLLARTAFAMADQDVRFYLNGMLWSIFPTKLQVVSSDGHRLMMSETAIDAPSLPSFRVIVPKKGLVELRRLLSEIQTEQIHVIFSETTLEVVTPELSFTTRLIDGQFPIFEQILPKNCQNVLLADRLALKGALVRASALFSDKQPPGVNLILKKDLLVIIGRDQQKNEVEEALAVEYQGAEVEIGFNVKYLIDFLNVIEAESVQFSFSDPNLGALIEGKGAEVIARYVVMPMRL